MPSRTSSGRFSRLLPHTELRLVFPRKRTSGFGALSKDNSRILTSASNEMSGFCGSPVPSFFIASGAHHVLDGYEPPGARALDRREVYAQLFRSTLGGVCGPRLLGFASPRGLPGGVLRILRRVAHRLLGLLGGSSRGVLRLSRDLPGLVGGLSRNLLGLTSDLSYLIGNPAQGTPAVLLAAPNEPTNSVLYLPRGLSGLLGSLAGRVLHALHGLAGLIGGLACNLLGLVGGLPRCFLGLFRRPVLRSVGLLIPSGFVFHSLGRLYHVGDDDASVGARAFDLREVHAKLFRLATFSLAPSMLSSMAE